MKKEGIFWCCYALHERIILKHLMSYIKAVVAKNSDLKCLILVQCFVQSTLCLKIDKFNMDVLS